MNIPNNNGHYQYASFPQNNLVYSHQNIMQEHQQQLLNLQSQGTNKANNVVTIPNGYVRYSPSNQEMDAQINATGSYTGPPIKGKRVYNRLKFVE